MADLTERQTASAGMPANTMMANVIRLAFGGDPAKFEAFCDVLREALPEDCAAVLRGSAVTGVRHSDHAPFDADGPGTSDLDLTLVGDSAVRYFSLSGFYVPGVHSIPLSDKHPEIAPALVPLRRTLVDMVQRPVNIQATRDWVMFLREHMFDQPYLTLVGKVDEDRP
jgi:hypothetical protein